VIQHVYQFCRDFEYSRVAEKPKIREKLVKTGWKSWHEKWREKAFKNAREMSERRI